MKSPQPFRLANGGTIDRARPVRFTFEGKPYQGFEGDTLASALLANGVRLVGRSFKYHRPRGIFGAGPEESNALMQAGVGARSTPNMRATEARLHDGLTAKAVNCWPSAAFDVGGVNGLISRFIPAGFYYKTFMWPTWHLFEWAIRRAAGLGKAPAEADPDRYELRYAHCDVLVVGSGAAGLAAARAAAASGARVILAEQDSRIGGQLLWDGGAIDGQDASQWAAAQGEALAGMPDVRVLTNTTVTGYFDHNALTMIEAVSGDAADASAGTPRYRQWEVRAERVVLATGAIERPLVFPGNDRPGVMLASAVRHYIGRYAVRPGQAAVIFTNNDEAYRTALAFHRAGGNVAAVVDTRDAIPDHVRASVAEFGAELHLGAAVVATSGRKALRSVTVRKADGARVQFGCDLLAVSGGANPTVHLFSQSGGRLTFDEERLMFVPGKSVQQEVSIGAAAGTATLSRALADGHAAGLAASGGEPAGITSPVASGGEHPATTIAPCWSVDAPGKAFVDLLNDVSVDDIGLSARENFVSVEHLKRYTTLGMGTDQGKTSNVNALAIMAELTGRSIAQTGTTRYRFPYVPTALGAFAGRSHGDLLRAQRRLPMHDWHIANGAAMDDYGWLRPASYPRAGESRHDAPMRESQAVRSGVGLFDGSPLGKIEVRGPDAGRLLDFIYTSAMSTLKVGKVRYGLMLNELGVIIDDGVCARLGEDHYLVGPSSAGAERIAGWLEEWLQCEFVDYDVLVAPVTTSWAVITLTGPKARAVLDKLGADFDIGAEAFPHMSMREGHVGGVPARVFRVSYTGEVSFEINVPTRAAPALWDAAVAAGAEFGITPIGIDAWNLLRLEKGYLHIGGDTDGTTTPLNVGWDHVMKRKVDFVGKRSLMLAVNQKPDRLRIVGLEVDGDAALPIGAHIVTGTGAEQRSDGFVTSSSASANLGRPVAMALIHDGRARIGETVTLHHGTARLTARICDPVRYDPEGTRLNG